MENALQAALDTPARAWDPALPASPRAIALRTRAMRLGEDGMRRVAEALRGPAAETPLQP